MESCPPGDTPWRCGWWNIPIPLRIFFFGMMALGVIIMLLFILQRVELWRAGQLRDRVQPAVGAAAAHAEIRRGAGQNPAPALPGGHASGHFLGIVLLFVGTVLGTLDTDVFELIFDAELLQGNLYLLEKVVLDLAALFVLVGLGLAVYRRYVVKPDRADPGLAVQFHAAAPGLYYLHRSPRGGVVFGRDAAGVGPLFGGGLSVKLAV